MTTTTANTTVIASAIAEALNHSKKPSKTGKTLNGSKNPETLSLKVSAPSAEEMKTYLAKLDAWSTKLASNAVSGATTYPQALKECNTLDDAVTMLNATLDKIVEHTSQKAQDEAKATGVAAPSFKVDSFEYQRAMKLVYDSVKQTLKNYSFDYIPSGLTIGQKKGRFVINKVQVRSVVQESQAQVEKAAKAEADNAKLGGLPESSSSAELLDANARINSQKLKITELETELSQKRALLEQYREGAARYIKRAETAEHALAEAQEANRKLAAQLADYKALISAAKHNIAKAA